ncbi:MAG: oxidoreductase [bacterium]|nr:oxidoreductase [bacterium]
MEKPKVAFFSLTSCSGCQISVLDLETELMEIFKHFDVIHFPLVKEENLHGPYDITFVEGAVANKEEIKKIFEIRAKSKIVIALGTCAAYGGVPAIKNLGYGEDIEKTVYHDPAFLEAINVFGIGNYVKVDYYIRGCPINKEEFIKVLKFLLAGKLPLHIDYPVCKECRAKGNVCLLREGRDCIGPVTYGGCDAVCPSNGIPCYGCRGPLPDANVDSLVKLFKRNGISHEDIKRAFLKYAGTSKKFQGVCELDENDQT